MERERGKRETKREGERVWEKEREKAKRKILKTIACFPQENKRERLSPFKSFQFLYE